MRSRRSGFTLIEILVALAVFVIGMSSVVYLLVQGAAAQSRARDATTVALLVENVLAELQADPRFVVGSKFPMGDDGWTAWREHASYPGYEFKVMLYMDNPSSRRVAAEVHVKYKSQGEERAAVRKAILLRNVRLENGGQR